MAIGAADFAAASIWLASSDVDGGHGGWRLVCCRWCVDEDEDGVAMEVRFGCCCVMRRCWLQWLRFSGVKDDAVKDDGTVVAGEFAAAAGMVMVGEEKKKLGLGFPFGRW
ncbi:hypothetical protein DEO72_LG4g914 [Vigna unguiculata]|uniref:Uncharacterized protein n=1 Tax=Vigna unguiculata TaxID=3917 RepID=A0A4D6LMD0_VIGUN|nr:hypothetical protein DEO72_LG4g914 [Vigna unguiculata]